MAPRPSATLGSPELQTSRTCDMGGSFILFQCQYGVRVRWLGGEYTNAHRNWGLVAQICKKAISSELQTGYPLVDVHSSMREFTEGVPMRGHFCSSLKDLLTRITISQYQVTWKQ
jgi:hypothetical protein